MLFQVFRETTGKQRFRETFCGACATAVPASATVLALLNYSWWVLIADLIYAHLK